jgi:hypothetical protein
MSSYGIVVPVLAELMERNENSSAQLASTQFETVKYWKCGYRCIQFCGNCVLLMLRKTARLPKYRTGIRILNICFHSYSPDIFLSSSRSSHANATSTICNEARDYHNIFSLIPQCLFHPPVHTVD